MGVLFQLFFGDLFLFPHILHKWQVILIKDRGKHFHQPLQLLIHLLRLFFLQLPVQLRQKPGQLGWMADGIVRLPVLLLEFMEIPGRPVQPDGGEPETVPPCHVLFQVVADHDDPLFVPL